MKVEFTGLFLKQIDKITLQEVKKQIEKAILAI